MQAPPTRTPGPGKSPALQARLRPLPHAPSPPKVGGVARRCSGGSNRKGTDPRSPSPIRRPARSGAGHPLAPGMIVLLFCCFLSFFCKLCPRPAPRLTRRCDLPSGLGGRPAARRLCIRSAPGRSELRTPSPTGGRGGWRGLRSPGTPSSSQTAASAPSRPRGRGPGAMGALRHPWRTLASRNRGSGIGTQTGSRQRRGRGRGVGRRGGEPPGAAPRLFPPPPPSRRRAHCLRPGSSRSRRPSHRRLQVPAALSGPGGGATTPHPHRRPGDSSTPGLAQPAAPPGAAFLDPASGTDPEPRGMAVFNALGPPSGCTKSSGI